MTGTRRLIAAAELVLIFPAALFMAALVARTLGPLQPEPARTAQQIVTWYSGRLWTLWGLLFGLPLVVLVTGCLTLLWNRNALRGNAGKRSPGVHIATLLIAVATLAAGVILTIVVVHVLMN